MINNLPRTDRAGPNASAYVPCEVGAEAARASYAHVRRGTILAKTRDKIETFFRLNMEEGA